MTYRFLDILSDIWVQRDQESITSLVFRILLYCHKEPGG